MTSTHAAHLPHYENDSKTNSAHNAEPPSLSTKTSSTSPGEQTGNNDFSPASMRQPSSSPSSPQTTAKASLAEQNSKRSDNENSNSYTKNSSCPCTGLRSTDLPTNSPVP